MSQLSFSSKYKKVLRLVFQISLLTLYFTDKAYDSISTENYCGMICLNFWIFKSFCYYLYCSPKPTTNFEITNPEFSRVSIKSDCFWQSCHWSDNSWKFELIFSELVIGSGDQKMLSRTKNYPSWSTAWRDPWRAWSCRNFCRTTSRSQRNRGCHRCPWSPWPFWRGDTYPRGRWSSCPFPSHLQSVNQD